MELGLQKPNGENSIGSSFDTNPLELPMTRLFLIPLIATILSFSCSPSPDRVGNSGVVRYYDSIPSECNEIRGLRQKELKQVKTEQELRNHYGMTFHVWFNDGITEELYGALYYQNREENLYCMALPDGSFAVFEDSQITNFRKNVAHEICYPLRECLKEAPETSSL